MFSDFLIHFLFVDACLGAYIVLMGNDWHFGAFFGGFPFTPKNDTSRPNMFVHGFFTVIHGSFTVMRELQTMMKNVFEHSQFSF